MTGQEEIVQEKKDDAIAVEVENEEKEHNKKEEEQKWHKYGAIIFFVLGWLFIFAPTYIQTDIPWLVIPSAILCLVCWIVCGYHTHRAYPDLLKDLLKGGLMGVCFFMAALIYVSSELSGNPPFDPYYNIKTRMVSFMFLFVAVALLTARLPEFIQFCAQGKEKIKAFFTEKHTTVLILGILSVATALFQFIQVLFQIFHL